MYVGNYNVEECFIITAMFLLTLYLSALFYLAHHLFTRTTKLTPFLFSCLFNTRS